MAIITLDKVSLAFGHHKLLDAISIGIEANQKIALIGRNGAGKSSFLKLLAKIILPDDGAVHNLSQLKVNYVAQDVLLDNSLTVYQELLSGLGEVKNLIADYFSLLNQLEINYDELTLTRLDDIQQKLEQANGWQSKSLIESAISNLNLDGNILVSSLSGGQKKKLGLAKAMINNPDVLLLDEPTNHLDINSVEWLEKVIKTFRGTVLVITHDRKFLDNTVNLIWELDRGKLNSYQGNFSYYQKIKAQQLYNEQKFNQEFDKLLAEEEVWIRKGVEARRTRNEGRVRRLEELREIRKSRLDNIGQIKVNIDNSIKSGKIVAKLDNISFDYEDSKIIDNLSSIVMRGDKIGLIGDNGVGKSTLLRLILGEIMPKIGTVTLGTNLQIAYFDQLRNNLDQNSTIADVISQGHDFIEINGRKIHVTSYLENFLFEPARFRSPVSSLSGGEKNRLLLARLFSKPSNILVLDEPTNDLDIETLELLEDLLQKYQGTVFLVSHDREFLNNVITNTYAFLGNGKIIELVGGYDEYLDYKNKYLQTANQIIVTPKTKTVYVNKRDNNKISYKEKQELQQLPDMIAKLEEEQIMINQLLADTHLYKNDLNKAKQLEQRLEVLSEEIIIKLARWEELEAKNILN
jgi:ATP-binding cassette subfamily F protein uup